MDQGNKRILQSKKVDCISCSSSIFHLDHATTTGCSLNIVFVFFPRMFNILRPLPRQHWASIGCTENCQPTLALH